MGKTLKKPSHKATAIIICKNCGNEVFNNFCNRCGQRADTHKLNMHFILHDLEHALIHFDKAIKTKSIEKIEIDFDVPENRSITPTIARKILAGNGVEIDIEKAKLVLDLLYKLSNLSVQQALKNCSTQKLFQQVNNNRPILSISPNIPTLL